MAKKKLAMQSKKPVRRYDRRGRGPLNGPAVGPVTSKAYPASDEKATCRYDLCADPVPGRNSRVNDAKEAICGGPAHTLGVLGGVGEAHDAGRARSQLKERIDCVQLLRAIAAIGVVTTHIPFWGNGAWGVDLFFVISGFIMCYVTAGTGRHFVTKRIIRVVPIYWMGTLAVFGVAVVAPGLLSNTTASLVDLAKSLAFIPFRKGQLVQPILFLGWTLNCEMFFYLMFALSMRVSHRYRAQVCASFIIAAVILGRLVSWDSVVFTFFTQPLFLEFVFGMLSYLLLTRIRSPEMPSFSRRLQYTLVGLVFLVAMPIATGIMPDYHRVIRWGIPAVLGFVCIVHGLSGVRLPKPIVLVGDASYSLYLLHPYAIQALHRAFGVFTVQGVLAYLVACMVVILCCSLAVLSYTYVEKPVTCYLRARFVPGEG